MIPMIKATVVACIVAWSPSQLSGQDSEALILRAVLTSQREALSEGVIAIVSLDSELSTHIGTAARGLDGVVAVYPPNDRELVVCERGECYLDGVSAVVKFFDLLISPNRVLLPWPDRATVSAIVRRGIILGSGESRTFAEEIRYSLEKRGDNWIVTESRRIGIT